MGSATKVNVIVILVLTETAANKLRWFAHPTVVDMAPALMGCAPVNMGFETWIAALATAHSLVQEVALHMAVAIATLAFATVSVATVEWTVDFPQIPSFALSAMVKDQCKMWLGFRVAVVHKATVAPIARKWGKYALCPVPDMESVI